jgi:hypothetical protein
VSPPTEPECVVYPIRASTPSDVAPVSTTAAAAHFSALVEHVVSHSRAVTLVVLVDTSCARSSHWLIGLLLRVLRWIRSSCQRSKARSIAFFVWSLGVANVFASQGLHFVKLQHHRAVSFLSTGFISLLVIFPLKQCL